MSRLFDLFHQPAQKAANETTAELSNDKIPEQNLRYHQAPPFDCGHSESILCHVRPEGRLVGCSENHNLGAEKFRLLRYRLNQLRQRRSVSKVLVTSAIPKEGKTVVATNLAISLALSFPRVALVDADMRQPTIHGILGLESLPGLAEFLEGKLAGVAWIRRVEPLGLSYLPAGHASTNPYELLQGPRMRELMELIEPAFDWIIFDSPPLISFADSHCLATFTDTVLLVVRAGVTLRPIVRQALAALDSAYVAGVVLNASDDASQDRYYYHYYPHGAEDNVSPSPPLEEPSNGNPTVPAFSAQPEAAPRDNSEESPPEAQPVAPASLHVPDQKQ